MGSVSQNLKATVSFGGKLDSSWRRSATDLRKNLQDVEQQAARLRKEQAELAAEMKRAALAGKRFKSMEDEYARLTAEIKKADAAQEKLNRSLERRDRLGRFMGKGKGLLAGTGKFAWNAGLAMGGGVVTSALGALIAPAAANAEMAETVGKASAYGVDTQTYMNWDALAKQYDMNGDNIGDLYEEYLHKAGEFKQNQKQNSLTDAFETLGFKDFELGGLSDMEQFEKIIDRALSMEDESKASFALDSLFGGEASKLLMLIKRSGKSFQELMAEQQHYNLVTKEGTEGALEGHRAFSDLRAVFSSAISEVSGQLGAELSPTIRQAATDLALWFKNGGITKIVNFLQHTLYPAALKFGEGVIFVGKIIFAVAKKLSWLLPDEQGAQRDVLEYLGKWGNLDVARRIAENNGQGEWLEKQLKENPAFVDDVKKAWSASQGRFFHDGDAFSKATEKYLTSEKTFDFSLPTAPTESAGKQDDPFASAGAWQTVVSSIPVDGGQRRAQLNDNSVKNFNFNIVAQPGQSEQGIADAVAGMAKNNPAFSGNNALWDGGSVW
ncbi:hypothetical protein J4M73_000528 [Salmonella enterica subsp. enterica serovar Poona]|nr:hypothetical protein [Salmonella enterica]EHK3002046.1 hypothetical protein [Salmonella enterica subsp. enterica serovar Poona]